MAAADDWVDLAEDFSDEWILLAGDEGSISSVFFGRAAAAFGCRGAGAAAPSQAVAAPVIAVAASRGRVLLCGAWSQYYLWDPAARDCQAVPRPRSASACAALFDSTIASDNKNCLVVRALDGRFEIYPSASGEWCEVDSTAAANVVAGSAAAFAGVVYWKTAASPGVLALDLAYADTCQIAAPPGAADPDTHWQLGVASGQLCSAVSTGHALELYGLTSDDEWKLIHSIDTDELLDSDGGGDRPRPLPFESDNLEVMLRVGGRVFVADLAGRAVREALLEGVVLPERDEDFVPWCRPVSTVRL